MTQMDQAAAEPAGLQQRIADTVTGLCGDMRFVYTHVVLFAVWIATAGFGSDSFPFNFLTMAVSLEAIFLSTFILISQNRQEAASEAHNEAIQQSLLKMLGEVIDDEKLDQINEELIQSLLQRIDIEHLRPMRDQIEAVVAAVGRIETAVAPRR